MIPSTSLSLMGFFQGLQGELYTIIYTIISILVIRWIALIVVKKIQFDSEEELTTSRNFINLFSGIILLISVVGFIVNATIFTTNVIPHSDLDKTSVYEQMNSNIKH